MEQHFPSAFLSWDSGSRHQRSQTDSSVQHSDGSLSHSRRSPDPRNTAVDRTMTSLPQFLSWGSHGLWGVLPKDGSVVVGPRYIGGCRGWWPDAEQHDCAAPGWSTHAVSSCRTVPVHTLLKGACSQPLAPRLTVVVPSCKGP